MWAGCQPNATYFCKRQRRRHRVASVCPPADAGGSMMRRSGGSHYLSRLAAVLAVNGDASPRRQPGEAKAGAGLGFFRVSQPIAQKVCGIEIVSCSRLSKPVPGRGQVLGNEQPLPERGLQTRAQDAILPHSNQMGVNRRCVDFGRQRGASGCSLGARRSPAPPGDSVARLQQPQHFLLRQRPVHHTHVR